jgi:hypothetical protein
MRHKHLPLVVAAMLLGASAAVASDSGPEPTAEPLGSPVSYEDPAGDVAEGAPDIVACGVSEPWQSLVSFTIEFASEPPLSYDMETWTTDEVWLMLFTGPEAVIPDDIEYVMGVHGATLAEEEKRGSTLFDTTRPQGDEVFWGVVDAEVEGPVLTLAVDRKLVGDPEVIYFHAAATSEGQGEANRYDACPDEEEGPGEYVLVG